MTNALILLAFYIYFVVSQSLYAIKDPFIQFSVWRSLPSRWRSYLRSNHCPFVPNILSSFYGIGRWSSLQFKEAEEETLKDPDLFEDRGPKEGKGTREDDASLMKEKQESPSLSLSKKKSNSLQVFFGLVSLVAFSKRFSFTSSGDDFYEWNEPFDQFSETCSDLGQVPSNLLYTGSSLLY